MEEEEQVEEEEEEREQENGGTDIFYPPKLQTCKNPQGLASIFNSGKVLLLCQPLLSGSPPPLCSPLLIDHTGQARHSTKSGAQLQPVPCSPFTLGNQQQSECGLWGRGGARVGQVQHATGNGFIS